jgi:exodeoxyribonuclease VII small subunit
LGIEKGIFLMAFGDKMERLQVIIERFESEDLVMEDGLALFEEGVGLVKECRQFLVQAKRRVTMLTDDQEVEGGL